MNVYSNADFLTKEETIKEAKKWLKCVYKFDCEVEKRCTECEHKNIVTTPALIERLLYFCEENNDAKETL